MNSLRPFLVLLLSLALGFAPIAAQASHQGGDFQTLVICTDAGVQTITLDGDGVPVQSGHGCFECCLVAKPSSQNPNALRQGTAVQPAKYSATITRAKFQAPVSSRNSRAPPALI